MGKSWEMIGNTVHLKIKINGGLWRFIAGAMVDDRRCMEMLGNLVHSWRFTSLDL